MKKRRYLQPSTQISASAHAVVFKRSWRYLLRHTFILSSYLRDSCLYSHRFHRWHGLGPQADGGIVDDWLLRRDEWWGIIDEGLLMRDYWWGIIDYWWLIIDYWWLIIDAVQNKNIASMDAKSVKSVGIMWGSRLGERLSRNSLRRAA